MNTFAGEIVTFGISFMTILGLAFVVLSNTQRIRSLESASSGNITRPALDDFARELLGNIGRRFDEMEVKQARREEERMAYLLKNAEQLGGVQSTNQLLTGQLATLAAKLDRQIEVTRMAKEAVARAALDSPIPYTS